MVASCASTCVLGSFVDGTMLTVAQFLGSCFKKYVVQLLLTDQLRHCFRAFFISSLLGQSSAVSSLLGLSSVLQYIPSLGMVSFYVFFFNPLMEAVIEFGICRPGDFSFGWANRQPLPLSSYTQFPF